MKYRLKPEFAEKVWANINGRMCILRSDVYQEYTPDVVAFYASVIEPEEQPEPEPEPKTKPKAKQQEI